MHQHVLQLVVENLEGVPVGDVAVLPRSVGVPLHDTVDELLQGVFPLGAAFSAAEVLGGHDGDRVVGPRFGELDVFLLEDNVAGFPVRLHDVTLSPGHRVVWVLAGGGVEPVDGQPGGGGFFLR